LSFGRWGETVSDDDDDVVAAAMRVEFAVAATT
jgi:hypothetical protein